MDVLMHVRVRVRAYVRGTRTRYCLRPQPVRATLHRPWVSSPPLA